MTNLTAWMGLGARAILILLFCLSIWSVAIMIDRRKAFKQSLGNATAGDARKYIQSGDLEALKLWAYSKEGMIARVIQSLISIQNPSAENLDRAARSSFGDDKVNLEQGFTVLATLGSNAPFIGLFGTVLGIIQSFGILSSAQSQGVNAVMSGLAEALVATAVGLFVAIPATVAYNIYLRRLKTIASEVETVRDLYISKFSR